MTSFSIHPQLAEDCHLLGRLEFCFVLLHRNAVVPWFILVPRTDVADLLDLDEEQRNRAMAECACLSAFIKTELGYPKINFGAIGNVVPQLHLHVIGRKPDDSCWPSPVWGNLAESREYSVEELEKIRTRLNELFGMKVIDLSGR